jgi:hypothetical protein
LPISAKPWDVRILKLNGLVKRYSSIEVAKDKSLISFNRNSHAKMAPGTGQPKSCRRLAKGNQVCRLIGMPTAHKGATLAAKNQNASHC